jgi:hypothetical protein
MMDSRSRMDSTSSPSAEATNPSGHQIGSCWQVSPESGRPMSCGRAPALEAPRSLLERTIRVAIKVEVPLTPKEAR